MGTSKAITMTRDIAGATARLEDRARGQPRAAAMAHGVYLEWGIRLGLLRLHEFEHG